MGRKTRSTSKMEVDETPNNITNDIWSENVKEIVKDEVKVLLQELTCLREEVRYLKESNIQLIHLLTNIHLNTKEKKVDNKNNNQKILNFLNHPGVSRNNEEPDSSNFMNNGSNLETNLKLNKTIEEIPKGKAVHKSHEIIKTKNTDSSIDIRKDINPDISTTEKNNVTANTNWTTVTHKKHHRENKPKGVVGTGASEESPLRVPLRVF